MEVPRLTVQLELQLLAYTTAITMPDASLIFDLHHSLWQHRILYPLRDARDQTRIFMDASWVLNPLSHSRDSSYYLLIVHREPKGKLNCK